MKRASPGCGSLKSTPSWPFLLAVLLLLGPVSAQAQQTNYRSIGTAPDDSTGSVNTTNSSPIVDGVGTSWLTLNRGRGDVISICDQAFPTCTTSTNYMVLAVGSNNQLTLTTPYTGSTGNHGYTIRRQFRGAGNGGQALVDWENCIDGGPCTYFGAGLTSSLVADNRREVGIVYKDSVFTPPAQVLFVGATTDTTHSITLTADGINRHNGVQGAGVVIDGLGQNRGFRIEDNNYTIEWLEFQNIYGVNDIASILIRSAALSQTGVLLQNLLIHDFNDGVANTCASPDNGIKGIGVQGNGGKVATIRNVMIWNGDCKGIEGDAVNDDITIENCTVHGMTNYGIDSWHSQFVIRNTISTGNPSGDFVRLQADGSLTGSNNTSSDLTAAGPPAVFANPQTSVAAATLYVDFTGPVLDLHLRLGAVAIDQGLDLSASFVTDIDGQLRQAGAWDRGADELAATPLFRSVGITATALASGAANALTISGSTATFASALPNNIGVGDAIQYDSDANNSIDAIAFIHGRRSSTEFVVKNAAGNTPTAVAGDNDWGLYRAYTKLANWESQTENTNINATVRNFDTSTDLVSGNTVMMVACYADGEDIGSVFINGWTTDPDNYIRIFTPVFFTEVGTSQRHNGVWSTSAYRLSQDASYFAVMGIMERYVRIDGLQLNSNQVVATQSNGIQVAENNGDLPVEIQISNNIIRSTTVGPPLVAYGIGALNQFGLTTFNNSLYVAKVWNNVIYGYVGTNSSSGIYAQNYGTLYVYNNTIVGTGAATHRGIVRYDNTDIHAKNNISIDSVNPYQGVFAADSTNNFSDVGVAPGLNPKTRNGAGADPVFVGGVDYHLHPSDTWAQNQGADLSSDSVLALAYDIDLQSRQTPWDIGADDALGTTAVELQSFGARAADAAVDLEWRTASELRNLGFHLYRGPSAEGPWTRLTSSLIPGLGSSPIGQTYSFLDPGLQNGVTYFYRLEDVDSSGVSTLHGPVSATPQAGASSPPADPSPPDTAGAARDERRAWGNPSVVDLRVLRRSRSQLLVELETRGFYTSSDPETGLLKVEIPTFEAPLDPKGPALPLRRALLDAVVGKKARIGSVRSLQLQGFAGLIPQAQGFAEMTISPDGTVRPRRRAAPLRASLRSLLPEDAARLVSSVFLGEQKKLVLEFSPLRYDPLNRRLILARRLRVLIVFDQKDPKERGEGSLGRRAPQGTSPSTSPLAFLHVRGEGLQTLSFEEIFPTRGTAIDLRSLNLSYKGRPVPFHVEPQGTAFGPGSRLFFHSGTSVPSTSFTGERVLTLTSAGGGVGMGERKAPPSGEPAPLSLALSSFETNRSYQPGLLETNDPWVWEALVSGIPKTVPFSLFGVESSSSLPAHLIVALQGASDVDVALDHHLRAYLNGVFVGEVHFDGKRPAILEADLSASLLREGPNELLFENTGEGGVISLVLLDRFSLSYPQTPTARGGVFDGTWTASGAAEVGGFSSPPAGVVEIEGSEVRWLSSTQWTGSSLLFRAEGGRRYIVASGEALSHPSVTWPSVSSLDTVRQADYILITPKAFLDSAQKLLERRQSQGLTTLGVSLEEIAESFGGGEASGEAIRSFLTHAFHHFASPAPRYALLLGGSTYDPRHFLSTSRPSPLPPLMVKTSYLWTVSDPTLAAVNGEDALADLAIGRLPATTVEEASSMIDKLLAWEDTVQTLEGRAVLVADNPDLAGDFEANQRDIQASFLADRESELLLLRELGSQMRPAILNAFNEGASLMSYVGHGGAEIGRAHV